MSLYSTKLPEEPEMSAMAIPKSQLETAHQSAIVTADTERLTSLIRLGREERFLEYKQSAPWDDLKHKIIRTALGMTNIRDGGTIFIGVPQRSADFIPEGMRAEHISTYKADEVQARINRFSDPYVRIELRQIEWDSKKFLAVEVSVSSISFKYKITPSLILNSPTLDPLPREPMTPTTTWLGTEESKHSDGKRTRIEGATQPMPTRAVPPDPEASEKPVRRRFTAEYRLRILREADARAEADQLGAL